MNIIYCQNCAAKVKKRSDTEYHCANCGQDFWNNPDATVAIVIIRNGKILVAKRGREPNKGMYDLPGGFLDYGEDIFVAAKREMKEEADLIVDDLEMIASYGGIYEPNNSVSDTILLAHTVIGEPVADDDVAELVWKDFSFLDEPVFSPPYDGLSQLLQVKYEKGEL